MPGKNVFWVKLAKSSLLYQNKNAIKRSRQNRNSELWRLQRLDTCKI